MSYFKQALAHVMQATGMSQLELSQACGLTSPQIWRYLAGASQPEFQSVNHIIEQFDKYYRVLLTYAYLRDQIPVNGSVQFDVNGFRFPITDHPQNKKAVPVEFLKALECIQLQGLASDSVREAIVAFAHALRQ